MIAELTDEACVHVCDGCGARVEVTKANLIEFMRDWYESIRSDFCPLCREHPKAVEDRAFCEAWRRKREERLMRTGQTSH